MQLEFHPPVSKITCDLFGKCTRGSKTLLCFVCMCEKQRKGAEVVVPAPWGVMGASGEGSRGVRVVLPHSKRDQEISASLVNLS